MLAADASEWETWCAATSAEDGDASIPSSSCIAQEVRNLYYKKLSIITLSAAPSKVTKPNPELIHAVHPETHTGSFMMFKTVQEKIRVVSMTLLF